MADVARKAEVGGVHFILLWYRLDTGAATTVRTFAPELMRIITLTDLIRRSWLTGLDIS